MVEVTREGTNQFFLGTRTQHNTKSKTHTRYYQTTKSEEADLNDRKVATSSSIRKSMTTMEQPRMIYLLATKELQMVIIHEPSSGRMVFSQ